MRQKFLNKLKKINKEWVEPTPCPNCGNYRLLKSVDENGNYECPQSQFCKKFWDNKLQLSQKVKELIIKRMTEEQIEFFLKCEKNI